MAKYDPKTAKKYVPPITREQFLASPSISIVVDGTRIFVSPTEFATGTLGYKSMGKVNVRVGDEDVKVQLNFQAYVCGSKPQEEVVEVAA